MNDGHRMAGALDDRGLVGAHEAVRLGLGEGALEQGVAKALRGLRQHDEFARNGGGDQSAVGGPLHLLDGVDGRHADNGRAMFDYCIDGPVYGGGVDQRADGVVHQDNVVRLGGKLGESVRNGLLAMVATSHDVNARGESELGDLGLDPLHLRPAHSHVDGGDPRDGCEGAQRMNEDRDPIERQELLGLRPGHPGAEACGGKNCENLHNGWSIQRRGIACSRDFAGDCGLRRFPSLNRNCGTRPYHSGMRSRLPKTLSINTALLKPGLRLAVGLSGGADSVALTRVLAEQSKELGLVLHAAHLHHGLRGEEADGDLAFARGLAAELGLPFHEARVETESEAKADPASGKAAETIEEAARRLRYGWLRQLMASGEVEAVATAHTLDDQADTVLAKFLRGAWTGGLSGIHPVIVFPEGRILRPLLGTTRVEVEAYLGTLGQRWREDSSNRHLSFTRNRIRHELLPLLEGWNPRLREHLAQMAALARDEETWWANEVARIAPQWLLAGRPVRGGGRAAGDGLAIDVTRLAALPLALQRRLLRHAAERLGTAIDFSATEALRLLAVAGRAGQKLELAEGLWAERTARELRLAVLPVAKAGTAEESAPEYAVAIPGEVAAEAFGLRLRIEVSAPAATHEGQTAMLRNWRPGDRVKLHYSAGPRKVKEVLERLKVTGAGRRLWPVLEIDGRIVWMRGVELEPTPGVCVAATCIADTELTSNAG